MRGLIVVIKADGEIHQLEEDFFVSFSHDFDLPKKDIDTLTQDFKSENLDFSIHFENHEQKIIFLKEAFQLAHVDGTYHEHENEAIYKLSENLGIDKKLVAEIEEWTSTGIKWYNQGLNLFGISENFIST